MVPSWRRLQYGWLCVVLMASYSHAYNTDRNDGKIQKEWRSLAQSIRKYLSFPTSTKTIKSNQPQPNEESLTEEIRLTETFGSVKTNVDNNNKNKSYAQRLESETLDTLKNYWQTTFEEIRNLAVEYPKTTSRPPATFFTQWKRFLEEDGSSSAAVEGEDNKEPVNVLLNGDALKSSWNMSDFVPFLGTTTLPRFEGFPSWERLLQDWADEVADYLEKAQVEPSAYPMSTFGKPSSLTSSSTSILSREKRSTTNKQEWVLQDFADDVADYIEKAQIEPAAYPMSTFGKPTPRSTKPKTNLASSSSSSAAAATSPEEAALELSSKTSRKRNQLPVPAPTKPGDAVLPHTDVAKKSKRILIVTTAALPWMTGTAVNPLLRAAYMTKGRKAAGGSVTLMLPWLERQSDQERVYGTSKTFDTKEDQEAYIRNWLKNSANMKQASEELKIEWYTAWQNKVENSVYSMGDITGLISADDVDICVLEEPEHLNWYRAPGESWTNKFQHVVGVIHTNYFVYAQEQPAALIRAPAMRLLCSWMCRAHCHRVIKLSGALGQFAPEKELVENVHGVRGTFLTVGAEVRKRILSKKPDPVFSATAEPAVYFIGKMLWSKGLGSLMELLKYAEESAGLKLRVDMYGGGPDKDAAEAKSTKMGLDMPFHGPIDHAALDFTHKVFINPSTSEVLCTTVAEALAMGKFVVVPSHPSNDFFAQFPNCLTYASKEEFVGTLYYALTHSPEPLSDEYAYALSWEAATERFEAAASISVSEAEARAAALSSSEAGIQITLPSLIESEEGRRMVATTLRRTRHRYRQFRSRLSQELQHSSVLPKPLRDNVVAELDKRLDLDIDEIIESPKLEVRLSPAELDKQLLELYNKISESPGGDVFRLIGGGQEIGLQNLYIKRQAKKYRGRDGSQVFPFQPPFPFVFDDTESSIGTVSQRIKLAMQRNIPARIDSKSTKTTKKQQDSSKMTMSLETMPSRVATKASLLPRRSSSFSLLI